VVHIELALGNPPTEILRTAAAQSCDLIAMASHGHKLIGDIIHGSTIEHVRHNTTIPIIVVRAGHPAPAVGG
jgi:manganese transport protein